MRRRTLLKSASLLAPAAPLAALAQGALPARRIPASGDSIPVIGLGTWITFNVGQDPPERARCVQVMKAFFEGGGRVIDSSPMYGSSQGVVGEGLARLGATGQVFSAEKVWTSGDGAAQIEATRRLWGVPRFDLMQVHNLLAIDRQLPLLMEMKARGEVRHVGITTSEGRRHAEIAQLLRTRRLDFVQLSYNPVDREAESVLLPLAAERGVAVLVNRPFQEGALVRRLQRHPLPAWAAETGAASWAQLVLQFILAHPAVTCVIPATGNVAHVRENLAAARLPALTPAQRQRIASHIAAL